MNPSPLELDDYKLTCLHIEEVVGKSSSAKPTTAYVPLKNAQISASVDIGEPVKRELPPHFAIRLRVLVEPREGKAFPYRVEIGLQGFFTVHASNGAKDAMTLAAVNGASMLYGVAREVLLAQTLRFLAGPLMLPSVHFLHLKRVIEDDQGDQTLPPPKTVDGTSPALKRHRSKATKASES